MTWRPGRIALPRQAGRLDELHPLPVVDQGPDDRELSGLTADHEQQFACGCPGDPSRHRRFHQTYPSAGEPAARYPSRAMPAFCTAGS